MQVNKALLSGKKQRKAGASGVGEEVRGILVVYNDYSGKITVPAGCAR